MKKYTIAVDAMGGDYAPKEIVRGAITSLNENNEIEIILVGKEEEIKKEIVDYKTNFEKERLIIKNATEIITFDDNPTVSIRRKKDSSMVVGMNLLKNGEADALVSAGNSGALLAGSTIIVGRIKGVSRPALATLIPNRKGFTFLIDSGANVDCKPEYLEQFAYMGSIYMEKIMGIENPKVGLVSNGTEDEKGNQLTKEAFELLKDKKDINFIGNVEGKQIPNGDMDVAVCDAFVGNVILKYTEGFASSMMGMIKDELMGSTKSKVGAFLAKDAFKNLAKKFDYREVGGAPFLGLKHLVVKAHGGSDSKAIVGAINQSYLFVKNDLISNIEDAIRKENEE